MWDRSCFTVLFMTEPFTAAVAWPAVWFFNDIVFLSLKDPSIFLCNACNEEDWHFLSNEAMKPFKLQNFLKNNYMQSMAGDKFGKCLCSSQPMLCPCFLAGCCLESEMGSLTPVAVLGLHDRFWSVGIRGMDLVRSCWEIPHIQWSQFQPASRWAHRCPSQAHQQQVVAPLG